ncbi:hypothetical protein NRF20_37300 [Streptomyces sp. R-74717]|uniref:hypothetical protein n=1 Tax=Streptomyces TaxID=1883 RepID=UPI0037874061
MPLVVAVPVRVRISVTNGRLKMEMTIPFTDSMGTPGGASGLRGIRERAALLGGKAKTGLYDGEWRVHASLPLNGLG